IGFYRSTYAGYVKEGSFREMGSSGGMGSWLAYTLLDKGLVDGIIHVHSKSYSDDDPRLFKYGISRSLEEIKNNSKSRYYPIELSEVLDFVSQTEGRFA